MSESTVKKPMKLSPDFTPEREDLEVTDVVDKVMAARIMHGSGETESLAKPDLEHIFKVPPAPRTCKIQESSLSGSSSGKTAAKAKATGKSKGNKAAVAATPRKPGKCKRVQISPRQTKLDFGNCSKRRSNVSQ